MIRRAELKLSCSRVIQMQGAETKNRYATYSEQFVELHSYSTFWSGILGFSIFFAIVNLFWSFMKRNKVDPGSNPWGGMSLEWTHTSSPPHPHNFETDPVFEHGPYDYDKVIVEKTYKK